MSLKMWPYGVKLVYECLGGHAIVGGGRRRHNQGKDKEDKKTVKTVYTAFTNLCKSSKHVSKKMKGPILKKKKKA